MQINLIGFLKKIRVRNGMPLEEKKLMETLAKRAQRVKEEI